MTGLSQNVFNEKEGEEGERHRNGMGYLMDMSTAGPGKVTYPKRMHVAVFGAGRPDRPSTRPIPTWTG